MKNLKKYRKLAKLTQLELANKTNLTRTYINMIEHNTYNPTIKTSKRIAKVLDVKWTKLYED